MMEDDLGRKYPVIKVGNVHCYPMFDCHFAGQKIVTTSRSKVETLVKELIDRMRELGVYVDVNRQVG